MCIPLNFDLYPVDLEVTRGKPIGKLPKSCSRMARQCNDWYAGKRLALWLVAKLGTGLQNGSG
jgi:hypothetical protein